MTGVLKEEELSQIFVIYVALKLENTQAVCEVVCVSGFVSGMGCSGSKVNGLPLVIRCKERKDLIRAAADHRYALAAEHVAYFHSLKDFGDALRKFVEDELVLAASSSSSNTTAASSPAVTLHSLEEEQGAGGHEAAVKEKGIHARRGKSKSKSKGKGKGKSRSGSKGKRRTEEAEESGSGAPRDGHFHMDDDEDEDEDENDDDGSHLHIPSDDDSDLSHIHDMNDLEDEDLHLHHDPSPGPGPGSYNYGLGYGYGGYGMMDPAGQGGYPGQYPGYFGMNQPYEAWDRYDYFGNNFQNNRNMYYMKKSAPVVRTVIHRPEEYSGYSNEYSGYPMQNQGFYGYPAGPSVRPERIKPADPPPPPSPPQENSWGFLNPFDGYNNNEFSGYGAGYGDGHVFGSSASSPDLTEVRMREGIPDLEEETESEVFKRMHQTKERSEVGNITYSREEKTTTTSSGSGSKGTGSHKSRESSHNSGEDGTKRVPLPRRREGSSSSGGVPLHNNSGEDGTNRVPPRKSSGSSSKGNADSRETPQHNEGSSRAVPSERSDIGVFEEEKSSPENLVSSKSPVDMYARKKGVSFEVDEATKSEIETATPAHGNRDLREVVAEIRDEFAAAYDNGKEVAVLLEVGKLPYAPNIFKVVLSRILWLVSPSLSSSHPPSMRSIRLAAKTVKLAKSYFGDALKDIEPQPNNLASTLEKLYAWEKKLYKEVKNEERLRVTYEKQCKRLQNLDARGAESGKIDLVRASIRKLLTRLDVSIKSINAISYRIEKLRDEVLQPQVSTLIYGLIRMWQSMLRCHQKQFQAIMESKFRALRAKTGLEDDSTSKATFELESELRSWCGHFTKWISTQKAYVESLNGWLMRCLHYEPEVTDDGIVPFSPGQLGAPPIFVVCHDWHQAMEMVSETGVANAMNTFASNLRDLWEKQDEEQRRRERADELSKDFRDQLKSAGIEVGRPDHGHDTNGVSLVASPHDDLKVDLDSVRKRLAEERAKHKDALKLLNYAASSSVQGGLVPIFRALESFSMEALKAHEQVRLQITN